MTFSSMINHTFRASLANYETFSFHFQRNLHPPRCSKTSCSWQEVASKGCWRSGLVRIVDSAGGDDVGSFLLGTVWHKGLVRACVFLLPFLTWRIDDLCNSFLTAAFAEQDASGRGMSKHVTTDGFTSVGACKESTGTRVGLNLIDDQDSDVELLGHLAELAEMLAKLALALIQLSTAVIVVAKVCHDAVDNKKTVLPARKRLGKTTELIMLIFAVLRTNVKNVFVGSLVVDCALSVCFMVSWARYSLPKRSEICLMRSGRHVPS